MQMYIHTYVRVSLHVPHIELITQAKEKDRDAATRTEFEVELTVGKRSIKSQLSAAYQLN